MTKFNQGWLAAEFSSARSELSSWSRGLRESLEQAQQLQAQSLPTTRSNDQSAATTRESKQCA